MPASQAHELPHPPDNLPERFAAAFESLDAVLGRRELLPYCQREGIAADAFTEPQYWLAVADLAYDDCAPAIEGEVSSDVAKELVLATPDFVWSNWGLNEAREGHLSGGGDIDRARQRMVHYGALIHQLGEEHPGIRVSELVRHLMKTVPKVSEPRAREKAEWAIVGKALGVQNENGLLALFEYERERGIVVEQGSVEEDLRGTDFTVYLPLLDRLRADGTPKVLAVHIDAKGSMAEIEGARHNAGLKPDHTNPCYVKLDRDGIPHATMFSMLLAKDYHDTLHPDPAIVAQRAQSAVAKLIEAVRAASLGNTAH